MPKKLSFLFAILFVSTIGYSNIIGFTAQSESELPQGLSLYQTADTVSYVSSLNLVLQGGDADTSARNKAARLIIGFVGGTSSINNFLYTETGSTDIYTSFRTIDGFTFSLKDRPLNINAGEVKLNGAGINQPNGLIMLDENGKIPAHLLP